MGETSNNFSNDINDYYLASSGGLAGGNSQVCENILELLIQKHFERKTLKFSSFFILLSILDKWGALNRILNARFPSQKPPHSSQILFYLRIFIEVFNIEINRAGGF